MNFRAREEDRDKLARSRIDLVSVVLVAVVVTVVVVVVVVVQDCDDGDHLGAAIDHPGDEVSGTTTAPGSLGRSHRCR
jgi:preprotein translocase subunit SecG